jgi:alcohol dehydrogenase
VECCPSLGLYSEELKIPISAFAADLDDHHINTALCPGGKERMRRQMNGIASGRVDLGPLVTHHDPLYGIIEACDLFAASPRWRAQNHGETVTISWQVRG